MLNTRKLIYILPEVCYVAELLPTKKPHTFAIQSFRQINATFMEDEELLVENVKKLFRKLEPETYTLVLPDFLFTNTIIDVSESSEAGVRDYLLTKLLPSLGLSKETHQLETFILTQHKGKTKVQLSGLEKSVLGPVFPVAEERGVVIEAICPLSWTLKSVISLEPSLSAVELGAHLYIAQHYIGVEQSTFFPTSELGNVIEAVRTLRGAEPNLQTLYLLTSPETGEEIKAKLKQRIPLQQLAEDEVSMDGLPAHLKTAIEAAAKTLDITDYPVPRFKLEKYEGEGAPSAAAAETPEEDEEEIPAPTKTEPALQEPSIEIFEESLGEEEEEPLPAPAPTLPVATTHLTVVAAEIDESPETDESGESIGESDELEEKEESTAESLTLENQPSTTQFVDRDLGEELDELEDDPLTDLTGGLSKAPEANDWLEDDEPEAKPVPEMAPIRETQPVRERPVIKNKNSTSSMIRMIGISIAALVITVLVGVGAGFALLQNSGNSALTQGITPSPKASPIAQVSPSPAVSPSPSASPSAALAKDKVRILVVNATGVTGKAGGVKTKLTSAGYKNVGTGNAQGTYQKGNFLLMDTQDQAFLAQLQKDSALTVSFGTEKKSTEDTAGNYDVVLVINE